MQSSQDKNLATKGQRNRIYRAHFILSLGFVSVTLNNFQGVQHKIKCVLNGYVILNMCCTLRFNTMLVGVIREFHKYTR